MPDDLPQRHERLNRLRKLGLRRGARDLPRPVTPTPPAAHDAGTDAHPNPTPHSTFHISDSRFQIPGEPVETPFGPAWVRTARFPLAERPDLAEWLAVEPAALAALDRNDALRALDPAAVAFIDTETTGLSLGAGTYTFLIAVGTYEGVPAAGRLTAPETAGSLREEAAGAAFVVRQFFMRNPGEERGQLHLVEEALGGCTGIVSFNGRGFDMPLIHNRFVLAAMPLPLVAAPHLDLLPPARRLYRAHWGSCSLGSLERNVLGVYRTAEDVPGYLIPDIYRQYYLTGAATDMLGRVFYHNLEDVISMPLLAAAMARLFRPDGLAERLAGLHPLEALSLGRCYDALNWAEAGVVAYRTALDRTAAGPELAQILRDLGFLYKRMARRDEAAEVWESWISTAPGDDLTPYVELAKYHEWHAVDLAAARGWAAWALRIAEGWPPGPAREEAADELRRRLARLERKLAGEG